MTEATPAPADGTPLLEVEDLRVEYRVGGGIRRRATIVRAVDGVDFRVRRGRTLGLVGESGCGKTTTAKAVLRLVPVASGRITLDGTDVLAQEGGQLRALRRRMQMVFQDPLSSLDPRKTVGAIVREPLDIHHVGSGEERGRRVTELLGLVGLSSRIVDRYPHQFSGGQRQRIGIARALALHPDLVVADEPISALDVSIQAQITNLLQELQERLGLAYLYIAHDLAVVRHICHEVAVMYLGRIVETSTTADVFDAATHPYTLALLSAVPIPDPEIEARRRRIILTGDVPSAARPPSGCHFHTRCWLRKRLGDPDVCATTDPTLTPAPGLAAEHRVACHFAEESIASPERASVLVASETPGPPEPEPALASTRAAPSVSPAADPPAARG